MRGRWTQAICYYGIVRGSLSEDCMRLSRRRIKGNYKIHDTHKRCFAKWFDRQFHAGSGTAGVS